MAVIKHLGEYRNPLACALGSNAVVIIGAAFGHYFLFGSIRRPAAPSSILSGMLAWDGQWYQRIVSNGYDYTTDRLSSIVFFPLYPDAAAALSALTGLSAAASLLFIANSALIASVLLFWHYLRLRSSRHGPTSDDGATDYRTYAVFALCFWPATFYFRMAYAESLFLAFTLAAFVSMQLPGAYWISAALCGAAIGTRPIGLALLPVLAISAIEGGSSAKRTVARLAAVPTFGAWGMWVFMAYQWLDFKTPFAFIHAQKAYDLRPWMSSIETISSLVTLEPLRCVYDPAHVGYWARYEPSSCPLFSMLYLNPVFFLVTVAAVGLGAWKRWLSVKEVVFAAGVLLIPYVAHAYPKCGASLGRYSIICFPLYIVFGRVLFRVGQVTSTILLACSTAILCVYSALFSAWYWFY